MNTFTLAGNLTADATKHSSNNGREFYSFTIAHNRVWYDKNREKQQRTTYFECLDSKEGHAKYLNDMAKKGNHAVIVGSLDIIKTEKDGKNYTNVKVIVDDIHLSNKSTKSESASSIEEIADEVFS